MRKISLFLSMFLIIVFMLALCGCGNGAVPENKTPLENPAEKAPTAEAPTAEAPAAEAPIESTQGQTSIAGDNSASNDPNAAADTIKGESQLIYLTIYSQALDQDMNLNIYLPAGYSSQENYPVLYMIHGYTGDQNVWMPGLKLEQKADELIAAGKIHPLIIVTPDIDNSYGINSSKKTREIGTPPYNSLNEGMYEDYIINDVISYVESNYSTITSKDGRYIGGLSMGGYAALHLAFANEDFFSKVGGHSPALFIGDFDAGLRRWLYPYEDARRARDPIYIAKEKDLTSVEVYLDCGDKDSYRFFEGCEELQGILQEKGVKSEYHLNTGEHDGQYWMENSEEYLLFYAGKKRG